MMFVPSLKLAGPWKVKPSPDFPHCTPVFINFHGKDIVQHEYKLKIIRKGKNMMQKQKCGVTYFLVVDITMEDMAACIHPESSHGPR